MSPILHDDNLLVPECQNMTAIFRKNVMWWGSSTEAIQFASDNQLVPEKTSSEPKLFNQQEFTALIKHFSLSNSCFEIEGKKFAV